MAKRATSPFISAPSSPPRTSPARSIVALALLAILGALSAFRRNSASGEDKARGTLQGMAGVGKGDVTYVEVTSGRGDVTRYAAEKDGKPMSIRAWMNDVAAGLSPGVQAASDLSNIISSSPYSSILFETPGASWETSANTQFEFALVDEPALQRFAENHPDRDSFAEHFDACRKSPEGTQQTVCAFANLGGDARLVAPLPQTQVEDSTYSHLAAFVRGAPKQQISEFWRAGASNYLGELTKKHKADEGAQTWFSTNGMGVAWLHLRLDSRPKYYSYGPFTRESTADLPSHIAF